MRLRTRYIATAAVALSMTLVAHSSAEAQGRGRGNGNGGGDRNGGVEATVSVDLGASVSISLGDRSIIQEFYATHAQPDARALPPGIRRNLERGKPLPPGIAKKMPPADLRSRIRVPEHYEIVEVGLDVLLVEVATGVIHDVLMDVIR